MNPRLSIVIPTYKREKMLCELLRSLEANVKNRDQVEIIVVDDGTPDFPAKEKFVRSQVQLPFVFITQPNSGPATARNKGVSLSKGEFIAFLDDDIEITPNWADEIIQGYDNEKIAGIAGYTKEYQSETITEKYLAYVQHLHRHQFNPDGSLAYICTANCSVKREAFLSVGGFSEELKLAAGDDMDLGFKLAQKGYVFSHNPKAVTLHKHRSSYPEMTKLFFVAGRGAFRCAVLHRDFQKDHITRVKKFDPALVFKTIYRVFQKFIQELRTNREFSKSTIVMFALFEISNHFAYQLGRYYEMITMKKSK